MQCFPLRLRFYTLFAGASLKNVVGTFQFRQIHQQPYSIVCVTVPDNKLANDLAKIMLSKKIIACANITSNVTSMYVWKGNICEEKEVLMWLKTRTPRVKDVITVVCENHPYEVPEIVSFPISNGSRKYLDWVGEVVTE